VWHSPGTCLDENTLEPLRLTCQTILWFVRLAQPTQNGFTFRIRTEREVGAAHAGEQPIRPRTDGFHVIGALSDEKRSPRAARFPPFHVIAGRHEQVGRPHHFLAKSIENRCRHLGNAVVSVTLALAASEPADSVMTVS